MPLDFTVEKQRLKGVLTSYLKRKLPIPTGLLNQYYILLSIAGTTEVLAKDFKVIGDGVTDDTVALQNALDFAGDVLNARQILGYSGDCLVKLDGGTFNISKSIVVRNGTTLIGTTKAPPYPNRLSGFKSNNNLFTGTEIVCSSNFEGENAIVLEPDNTNVENIILDGHSIPCGTCWSQIDVTTAQGRYLSTAFIKFPVNDSLDKRISSLKFDNIEIPYFRINEYMEFQLQGIGGSGNYTYSLQSGSLPDGLSISTTGLISGTATVYGVYYPVFRINDGTNSFDKTFTVGTIIDEILTRDILPATVGASYSFQLETRYKVAGLTWSGVDLPNWLSLSSSGLLTTSNTTTVDDVKFFKFKVNLKDSLGNLLDKRVYNSQLRYADGSITIFGDQRLKPETGLTFNYIYKAHGGYGSYTWSINVARSTISSNATLVTANSPFAGLNLNTATGEISGIPTTTGVNTYYLRATSTVNPLIFFEGLFYIESLVAGSTPKIFTRSFKTANKNTAYSFQFAVQDIPEAKPYIYKATGLPTGLSIDSSTGIISGIPTGATFTNGVRIQWSDSVKNCTIRGFRSGGGIYSSASPSNVHRISSCMISVCDAGFQSVSQTYDSHFSDLYIFNCRVGMDLGPGSAGLTVSDTRIEYIHEDGVNLRTANENDFNSVYFDTCGWSSIRATDSRNLLVTGCRFFRSGRNLRGHGVQFNSKANRDYSNHIYLEDCKRATITGNTFDLGTKDGGDGLYLTDHFADNLRPYTGIRLYNSPEVTIVGNNLSGCVNNAYDANLTDFGENNFYGWNIANNVQTDNNIVPLSNELLTKEFYIPNQCFQIWQRDKSFTIPASTNSTITDFPIADGWTIKRGGNTTIDKSVNVSQGIDSNIGKGFYLHIDKAVNTTAAPNNNFQTLELFNSLSPDLYLTSNRSVILSYYAKSTSATSLGVKVSQYCDSSDNAFASYQFSDNPKVISSKWKRYQHYFELEDLSGIKFGNNAIFNIIFRFEKWSEVINCDITGVQIDFVDKAPFARDLREGNFETELAFAQLRYQKSKQYSQYFPSWSNGYRYDVNGANFNPFYLTAYSPSTIGAQLTATVTFENPVLLHPGDPDSVAGKPLYLRILNPGQLINRTSATKYTWSGSNNPSYYIDQVSKQGFKVSARNATTVSNEVYACHWIYTTYSSDLNSIGGGYF